MNFSVKSVFLALSIVALSGCKSDSSSLVVKAATTASSLSRGVVVRVLNDEGPVLGSPSSTTFRLYALYVSPNLDCSSPVLVQDYGAEGVTKNLFESGITLFEGNPADGNYECLILKTSDNIVFRADSTAVNAAGSPCVADTDYTIDIYRTDSGDTWKDIDGNNITATGSEGSPGADVVYVFISRDATAIPESTAHLNQTGELSQQLVVPGQTNFYADGSNQVVSAGGTCGLNGLTMGFR